MSNSHSVRSSSVSHTPNTTSRAKSPNRSSSASASRSVAHTRAVTQNKSATPTKPDQSVSAPAKDESKISTEAHQPEAPANQGSHNMVQGLKENFSEQGQHDAKEAPNPGPAQENHSAPEKAQENHAAPEKPAEAKDAKNDPKGADPAADPQKAAAAAAAQPAPPAAQPPQNGAMPAPDAARIAGANASGVAMSLRDAGLASEQVGGAGGMLGKVLAPVNMAASMEGLQQGTSAMAQGIGQHDLGKVGDGALQTASATGGLTASMAGTASMLGAAVPEAAGPLGAAAAVGFDGLRETINSQDGIGKGIGLTKMGAAGLMAAGCLMGGPVTLAIGGALAAGAYIGDTQWGREHIQGGLDMASHAMDRLKGILGG